MSTAYHGAALAGQKPEPKPLLERGGVVILREQRTCGCGHVAMILLNRGGRTYCVLCAPAAPKETK